jgi:hypothetical protein
MALKARSLGTDEAHRITLLEPSDIGSKSYHTASCFVAHGYWYRIFRYLQCLIGLKEHNIRVA